MTSPRMSFVQQLGKVHSKIWTIACCDLEQGLLDFRRHVTPNLDSGLSEQPLVNFTGYHSTSFGGVDVVLTDRKLGHLAKYPSSIFVPHEVNFREKFAMRTSRSIRED